MAELVGLAEGIAALVRDGDTVALEGLTHLIPVRAGQEIVRQDRRDLTLVRMTPDIVYDQMIGAGCARRLVSVERGWPVPLELEEHSHAGMANAYAQRADRAGNVQSWPAEHIGVRG